jgi:hypothetical protein
MLTAVATAVILGLAKRTVVIVEILGLAKRTVVIVEILGLVNQTAVTRDVPTPATVIRVTDTMIFRVRFASI